MNKNKVLKATHSGFLNVGKLSLPCYVLEDGSRVLTQGGAVEALGMNKFAQLPKFISNKALQPFIDKDLNILANSPITFMLPGAGRPAKGYKGTILADVCDAVLQARKEGKLKDNQKGIADQCEILTRSFAKIGIIALIDEATGYIREKKKNEYIELFKQFVLDEAKEWQKEFPEPFFNMIYKIYGKDRLSTKNHPQYFGKFIKKYVYQPLAGSDGVILEMLEEKNPKITTKSGTKVRKKKLFQFLEGVGTDALRQHIWKLIGLGEACESKAEFERKFAKVFTARNQQLELAFKKAS